MAAVADECETSFFSYKISFVQIIIDHSSVAKFRYVNVLDNILEPSTVLYSVERVSNIVGRIKAYDRLHRPVYIEIFATQT